MDEIYLISQSKNGDKSAFSALVEIYQNKLYRTAYGILGNSQDAYDALQDCILKAYLSIGSLRNDYYFKYWLNRILINSCNDMIRRKKKIIYIENPDIEGGSDEYDDSSLDMKIALGKLEQKYRVIISLRYYQDLSYEDMADILNCPVGTVKSRLNYAIKKLRETLEKGGLKEVGK